MKSIPALLVFLLLPLLGWSQSMPFNFKAKALLVLSDADMLASAYADGYLGSEAGVEDSLNILRLEQSGVVRQQLHVPNSVVSSANDLNLSNDQNTAFVVDTRLGLPRDRQQVSSVMTDLPPGHTLYAIDLRDPFNPTILDQIQVQEVPMSIDVNPVTGQLLIAAHAKGKEIAIVDWEDGRFGKPTYQSLDFDTAMVAHASWHPSGKFFGLTIEPSMHIQFYQMTGKHLFKALGKPVPAGNHAGAGRFSNNGNYYIVPDLQWQQGYNYQGYLQSIKFEKTTGMHQFVGKEKVDISPEGFAISPDGSLIAVSNMGTNFMPVGTPIFGKPASISLLGFDENTGEFTYHDRQVWEGILPQGITFDAAGEMLAITSFDRMDLTQRGGYVSFWKVEKRKDGKYRLVNTGFQASVTRGAHYIQIVK